MDSSNIVLLLLSLSLSQLFQLGIILFSDTMMGIW